MVRSLLSNEVARVPQYVQHVQQRHIMKTLERKNANVLRDPFGDFFDGDLFAMTPDLRKLLPSLVRTATVPAVNVSETATQYMVEFAAPGMKKEDFKLSIDDNMLTVSATTSTEKKEESKEFTRQEFNYSSFTRSFTLPDDVLPDSIKATYLDGMLKITIGRSGDHNNARKREITVD